MKKTSVALLFTIVSLLFAGCSFIDSNIHGESENNSKTEMPNVVGSTYSDAYKKLSEAGFVSIEPNREQVSLDQGDKWIVSGQSETEGTQVSHKKKIVLSCIQETRVYFEIESDNNFIFSTYDVVVSLDNSVLMTIPNGEIRTSYQELMEGEHTLSVCSAENQDVATSITIHIEGETYYRCEIKHTKDSVKIKDIKQTNETIVRYLKVIDAQGMPLDKAQAALKEAGFINVEAIDTDKNESITLFKDDYMVVNQSIAANKEVDKNDYIELKCVSIDDYLRENFDEATILDAEKILAGDKYSYSFIEAEDKSVDISSMSDEEKELWIIQKIDWTTSKGASFTVKKHKIGTIFDLHCYAKTAQTIRYHDTSHYLINSSNHLIVSWDSSLPLYTWGYYIGDINGLFYLVTDVSCGKCDSKGSSSSFTHYGKILFDQPVTFTVGKPWDCEDKYEDILASKPSDISNYTEIHAHIDGKMLLIRGTDYSTLISVGKKLGWKVESDGVKQSTGELECIMNTGKDGLKVTIRYSPSTKEISYLWIQDYDREKKASFDRKKQIALAIATAICPPEDADTVKAWVSGNLSATRISNTIIHGVPYKLGHNDFGNFVFAAGFEEKGR